MTKHEWPEDSQLRQLLTRAGSMRALARHLKVPRTSLQDRLVSRGIQVPATLSKVSAEPIQTQHTDLHDLLRRGVVVTAELADRLDISPKRVRSMAEDLRHQGYRVELSETHVELIKIPPQKYSVHKSLLEGDHIRVGIVSDTHLSSNEQALGELNLAYDTFVENGITEVYHAGDWTCGRGIYRTQERETMHYTFETQVDYLVKEYPRRDGIRTRGISGNHDVEGDFGRLGANPVAALAHQRDDIDFLGDFSAFVELPNDASLHLLHGKGGMSNAYSAKAQKIVEGYPAGRKPNILVMGHFHRAGWFMARGIQTVFPGCFEWTTPLLARLGLVPQVGFYIFDIILGDDGSVVKFTPQFYPFYEGRKASI